MWKFFGSILSIVPPIIGTVLFLVILTIFLRFIVQPFVLMRHLKKIPGARLLYTPFLGMFWHFKRDEKKRGDFHYRSKKEIQEHPNMRFLVSPYKSKLQVLLYDPTLVKEFLAKEAAFTCKDPRKFKIFHKAAQSGLPFAQGDKWLAQREFITSVFNKDFVNDFIPIVQETAKEWIGHNFKEDANTVDAVKKVRWFTGKIATKLFFGEHGFSSPDEFKQFMKAGIENQSTWMKIKQSPWRFLFGSKFHRLGLRAADRNYNQQIKLLDQSYTGMVEKFKKSLLDKQFSEDKPEQRTLLGLFLHQNTKNPEKKLSEAEIIGQISTFFSAETNSTAAFLTSALYLLAKNKDAQQKLRAEVQEHYPEGAKIDFEMLSRMTYLDSFLKETFRMQTPTSLLYQRKVKDNMNLLDLKLKKGDRVNIDVLGIGYNPQLFSNPTEFQPERWIEKKDAGVSERFAHIPFSEGSHKCPGQQFALTESKILLCEMVKKFEIGVNEDAKATLGFDFVYHITSPVNLICAKI